MQPQGTDKHGTRFTVSVDHRSTGTGISAVDRSATIRALVDAAATATDFYRPGHVYPLVAAEGGLSERKGHTEAALELVRRAFPKDSGVAHRGAVICELVNEGDGMSLEPKKALAFAVRFGLSYITIEDLEREKA